jgi:glutamyl-tRNA synthetase
MEKVRVRYAPSPTGEPHPGNIRTALFNWLFARRHKGVFIVRIEDTDRDRYIEGAVPAILEALQWLGLDWDEGPEVGGPFAPYIQSQRLPLYQEATRRLLERGCAYYCYCSPERLEEMRREQMRRGLPPGYDRRCRDLPPEERRREEAKGIVPVVRFKVPLSGETTFYDLIRGEVSFQNRLLDDFVILKSDGYPTYHLANVVDDHFMEVTHVLRAEEWLPSTPRHILLYEALGYEPPLFGHLPMILGPDRSKLSKRHGATSILEYKRLGYLPEALVNFLALLGWSLDDRTEIIPRDVLMESFSLERIGKAGAIFNREKLLWMNGVYIRQLDQGELARRLLPFLERDLPPDVPRPIDETYLQRIVPLIQERLKTLADVTELAGFFFREPDYDGGLLVQRGMEKGKALQALRHALEGLEGLGSFDAASLEALLRPMAGVLGLTTGQLFGTLRVATTGRTAAPPLFQTMEVLGRERCLKRIQDAIARLEATDG